MELFRLLVAARWLTTSQVHRRFFADSTMDAARKRLRKLSASSYLNVIQENPMSEALFTLGREGKLFLERCGDSEIILERTPPKHRAHFTSTNDIRLAAELQLPLTYFFAYWELPALGWAHRIIPDAVFAVQDHTFAVEFDRGLETIQYFLRTKVEVTRDRLEGFPIDTVLIVTDRRARMESLAKAIAGGTARFLFSTLDAVKAQGLSAPVFFEHPDAKPVTLYEGVFSNSLAETTPSATYPIANEPIEAKGEDPLREP